MQQSQNQAFINFINNLKNEKKIRSLRELAIKIKFSSQYLNQVMNLKAPPSDNLIDAVAKLFPDLRIKLAEQMIGKPIHEISEAHEDMVKYNARSQGNTYKRMIPVVHYRAQAGFSEGWSDQEWIDDLPTVEVEWPKDGNYLAFEVTGDSMECDCKKNISDRDIVIAREVARHHWANRLHIPDTFVIVQRMDGILVKEIIKHDVARGVITCHSNNALFPDFGLSLEDVEKLYHVKEVRRRW